MRFLLKLLHCVQDMLHFSVLPHEERWRRLVIQLSCENVHQLIIRRLGSLRT